MNNYSYEEIEDALIKHLKDNVPGILAVTTYENELDKDPQRRQFKAPSIMVELDSMTPRDDAEYDGEPATAFKDIIYNVYIVAKSFRGVGAAKRTKSGAYTMANSIEAVLWGRRTPVPGHGQDTQQLEAWKIVGSMKQVVDFYGEYAIYLVQYMTSYLHDIQGDKVL